MSEKTEPSPQSLAEQALAGLPEYTDDRATYQGQFGYWVQGEAKFVPCSNPGTAIAYYRQRLTAGDIAVDHNHGTACVGRMMLYAQHAAFRQMVAAELRLLLYDESTFPQLDQQQRTACFIRNTQVKNMARILAIDLTDPTSPTS